MDQFTELFTSIFSLSICGISLGTIITIAIGVVKSIHKSRKQMKQQEEQIKVTKESIETSFKNAVFPKTVKLDVSKKIQEPINKAMEELKASNDVQLAEIKEENKLILKVLSQFTHVQKLPQEDQEKIADIVNEEVTEEMEV